MLLKKLGQLEWTNEDALKKRKTGGGFLHRSGRVTTSEAKMAEMLDLYHPVTGGVR